MAATPRENVPLAPLTTLGVGGPARHYVRVDDPAPLADAVDWAGARGVPAARPRAAAATSSSPTRVIPASSSTSRCAAWPLARRGTRWTSPRRPASTGTPRRLRRGQGLGGHRVPVRDPRPRGGDADPERRRLRPGRVGDDRRRGGVRPARTRARVTLDNEACRFGYRMSRFKADGRGPLHRLGVTYRLRPGGPPAVKYAELARHFAERGVAAPSLAEARAGGDRGAPPEVDGARSRRSQRAQRRVVLHEPDRGRGEFDGAGRAHHRGGRRCRSRTRSPTTPPGRAA